MCNLYPHPKKKTNKTRKEVSGAKLYLSTREAEARTQSRGQHVLYNETLFQNVKMRGWLVCLTVKNYSKNEWR